jgi:hypothetical protein
VASSKYSSYGTKRNTAGFLAAQQGIKCTITWDSAARVYSISTPYEPNFVEFIKAKIPGRSRAWDPGTKLWTVEEEWMDILRQLAIELWTETCVSVTTRSEVEDAEKIQREAQQQAILQALPERERALYEFLKTLPFEAVKAAYRKAAMELHPDRNPTDGEAMSKLNAAWAKVEVELKKEPQKQ